MVFIPERRRKTIYVELRPHLGEVSRKLAGQKESRIEKGHHPADHAHMIPKYDELLSNGVLIFEA